MANKNWKGAIDDLTRALALRDDDANCCNERGYAYENAGDLQAALADYKKAEAIFLSSGAKVPEFVKNNLGRIQARIDKAAPAPQR